MMTKKTNTSSRGSLPAPRKGRPGGDAWVGRDWDALFSREEFRLTRGRDFTATINGMTAAIRREAWRRGVGVSVLETGPGGQTLRVTVRKKRTRRVKEVA